MSTENEYSVAVIMRTRNRPHLLRRAVADVLRQTYPHVRLCIVNDGGAPEAVEAIVAEFGDQFAEGPRVVHNTTSVGREAAINVGLDATESTYVVIHDDDDTWDPTFLSRAVSHLEATNADGVAVRTEIVFERITGTEIVELGREVLAADRHELTLSQVLVRGFTPPISVLYRRALHERVGLYDGSLPVLADWDFLLRALAVTEFEFIDGPPLAFWHHRPSSISDDGNSVITASDDHQHYESVVRDRYLRREIQESGGLGSLLYLTAQIRDQREEAARQLHLAVQRFDAGLEENSDAALLRELNQNLISQSNRLVAQFEGLSARVDLIEQLIRNNAPRARLRRYGSRVTRLVTGQASGRSVR